MTCFYAPLLTLILLFSNSSSQSDNMKFLALGDSYTIGESVNESARWPMQLVNLLKNEGIDFNAPEIIARTGWTTAELAQGIIEAEIADKNYDLVSLSIGVNNQYRGVEKGYTVELFHKEFEELVIQAISFAGGKPSNVFVLSIPDWGVTTFAKAQNVDAIKIGKEIDSYNDVKKSICHQYNVIYFDITAISREAGDMDGLLADDGLHPSVNMYKKWVDVLIPWFKERYR